nr:ribonuclease H-like domain-containing protein [Tanacetum cinerariifolium]
MDVKSAFLYGKIEEEVYVCQPLGFEDPDFSDRVYKVEKALYEVHQAPKACDEFPLPEDFLTASKERFPLLRNGTFKPYHCQNPNPGHRKIQTMEIQEVIDREDLISLLVPCERIVLTGCGNWCQYGTEIVVTFEEVITVEKWSRCGNWCQYGTEIVVTFEEVITVEKWSQMEHSNPTIAKILILDTGKFKQWKFRIQQYLQNEHYALWEDIKFGDSYEAPQEVADKGSTSEGSAKKKGRTVAVTTEDMQKRRNDVKARATLLLALPDKHQLRFSKYKTAQELWAAILKTIGGNEATKKTKKNQVKQQYGNFKAEGK